MCWQLKSVFILLLQLGVKPTLAQTCLQAANGEVPFVDLKNSLADCLPSGSQAIVTSYQFQCCGRVTRLQTFVTPGGLRFRDGVYSIRFQVWRPGPAVESDGCYCLVGEDVYNDVILGRSGLVSRVVPRSTDISVQPGDVLGYHTTSINGEGLFHGVQLDQRESDEGERVRYSDIIGSSYEMQFTGQECPVRAGEEGTLNSFTNSAPIFSIDISTSSCQTLEDTSVQTATFTNTTTDTAAAVSYNSDSGLSVREKGLIAGVCVSAVLVVTLGILAAAIVINRRKAAGSNGRDLTSRSTEERTDEQIGVKMNAAYGITRTMPLLLI